MDSYLEPERALIARLTDPGLVQRWLDTLPYNWEPEGETLRSFRGVVRAGEAHCLESALAAAAVLEQHGHPPLLLDLGSADGLDHVLFLFRGECGFGSVGASREPGLEGRKPVYRNLHTLVQSYAAPYIDEAACIVSYGVFDLRALRRGDWRTSERNVWHVERALLANPHRPFRVAPRYRAHWRRRYGEFKRRNPQREPVFYPTRRSWL